MSTLKSISMPLLPESAARAVCDPLLSVPPITVPLSVCPAELVPPAFPACCSADPDEPSDESVPCTSEAANVIGAKLRSTRSEIKLVPAVFVMRLIRYSERTP